MTLQAIGLVGGRGPHARAHPLFSDLDVSVGEGESLRVTGRNGSGKSTLLRTLCGLIEPLAGELLWRGRSVRRDGTALRSELLYIGHALGLKDDLSALENLRVAQALAGRPCSEAQALQALQALGLGPRTAGAPARTLSQGQKRRAVLARLALPVDLVAPGLLVLDEPFNALDTDSVAQLTALLTQRLAQGAMLIYTTHQDQSVPARQAQTWHLGVAESAEPAGRVA